PESLAVSGRPIRRSCHARLRARRPTLAPIYRSTPLPLEYAPPQTQSSSQQPTPVPAAPCDQLSRSASTESLPGSRKLKAPCTLAACPLNKLATRCHPPPHGRPHKLPVAYDQLRLSPRPHTLGPTYAPPTHSRSRLTRCGSPAVLPAHPDAR